MTANYHTHTYRCHHASMEDERAYVEAAIEAGYTELGFADHSPMPLPAGVDESECMRSVNVRMTMEETEGYIERLLSLREEYKKDIKLHIGFEAEYYPAVFDRFIDFISDYPIDYLIMGQHWMNNEYDGPYFGSPTDNPEILRAYVDQVIEGLSSGKFSYLAHPDLPNFSGDEEAYKKEMRRLIELGCDCIMTDNPILMKEVLAEYAD